VKVGLRSAVEFESQKSWHENYSRSCCHSRRLHVSILLFNRHIGSRELFDDKIHALVCSIEYFYNQSDMLTICSV